MNRTDGSELVIGDRIECDDYFGTIRFIGEVESIEDIWLGIDWDDIQRGKHDGSYKGRRYFQAEHPKSGSFIKPLKAKLGQSFPDAYIYKINEVLNMPARILILSQYAVYGLGTKEVSNQFSETASKITELDLSYNLLNNWTNVAEIANLTPNLLRLNLSNNRLIIPGKTDTLAKSFSKVGNLVLNRINYNWSDILSVSSMFPSLQSLYVCFNNLERLIDTSGKLTKLKFLTLTDNQIKDWNEVLKLGQLPALNKLYLSNNQLSDVFFNDVSLEDGTKSSYFPSLESLDLNYNLINMSSIDELGKLANLTELSCLYNPVNNIYEDKLFYFIVGKIGTLKIYAKANFNDAERRNCEVYYLRMIEKMALEKNISQEDMAKLYSRYKELVKIYGHVNPESLVNKTSVLRDKLITVDIQTPNVPDKVIKNKKLSPNMTIMKLKSLVQRLFKIEEITNLTLSYLSKENPEIEIPFENDLQQLSLYSMENGDSLIAKW